VTRFRIGLSWPLLIAIFGFAMTLAPGARVLADPDILWQVVTGNWILAHGAVPHADPFSYTMAGAPWVAHEWLADALLALSYDAMGWHGPAALAALAAAAALGLLTRALLRWMIPIHAVLLAVLAWLMLLPHLLARPHLLALPLLVAWVAMLLRAREQDRAPALPFALLMVLWANLHGTFLFGLGFAGLMAGEAVLSATGARERWTVARSWGAFLALSALAPLLSPNGLEVYLLPLHLLSMSYTLSMLIEWRSPSFDIPQPLELWLLIALAAGFALRLKLPLSRLAILLLLVHSALTHWRHGELLGFVAPLLLAPALGPQLMHAFAGAASERLDRWMLDLARPASLGGMVLAGALLLAGAGLAATRPLQPPEAYMPEAAVHAAIESRVSGPVLNEYRFGGYLIFAGIPTFVDGRADMFGDAFIERENKAITLIDDDLPALLHHYKIGWTLMPAGSRAAILLDHLAGWRRLYADDIAVVHVRAETPQPR
jgi:hypothetical protein